MPYGVCDECWSGHNERCTGCPCKMPTLVGEGARPQHWPLRSRPPLRAADQWSVVQSSCPECNGWGWIESDRCTCGTGPSGYYGMHERHCGLEPCPAGCPFIPPAPSCGCSCGCPAPGQRDDDGTLGWCDSCRMNIHPVTAKTEA